MDFSQKSGQSVSDARPQSKEYGIFVDMIDRAHTYFDKTLSLVEDKQLLGIEGCITVRTVTHLCKYSYSGSKK